MQHVLMRLWHKAQALDGDGAAGVELRLKDYESEEIGGIARALDLHAEEAYGKLDRNQQRIAEVMFRLLSERDAGTGDEGRPRDTRRPTPLQTVADVAGAGLTPDDVARVVEHFRAPGLNFLTPTDPLDVSHESLIRRWRRLQSWVEAEAKSAGTYRRLAERARDWREGNSNLLRRRETDVFLEWRDRECPSASWARRYGGDFDLAMQFLDDSDNDCKREEITQERRRNERVIRARWIAIGCSLGLLAALGVAGFVMRARDDTKKLNGQLSDKVAELKVTTEGLEQQTEIANALAKGQASLVRSFLLANRAEAAMDKAPQLAALLAVEAVHAASIESDKTSALPGSEEALIQTRRNSEEALRQALRGISGRGLCGNTGPISHVAATSDGRRVVTAGDLGISLWEVPDRGLVPQPSHLRGPKLPLNFLAIPPGDRWIIAKDSASNVYLWRLREGSPAANPEGVPIAKSVSNLLPSSQGRWLVLFDRRSDSKLGGRLWDLTADQPSGRELELPMTPRETGFGWSFDPDDKWLAIVKPDLTATCWNLRAPQAEIRPARLLPGSPGFNKKNTVISPDCRRLIVSLLEGKARVWELDHPEREPRDVDLHDADEAASTSATDQRGRWAVTTAYARRSDNMSPSSPPSGPPRIRLWDLSDPELGKHSVTLQGPDRSTPISFFGNLVVSDNGKWLASNTMVQGFLVWNLSPALAAGITPFLPLDKEPAAGSIPAFAFSPDCRWLLTGGRDGVGRAWDLTSRDPFQHPLTLRGQEGPITDLTVSRDSRRLVTGGKDGTARLWDLDSLSPSADPVEVRAPAGNTAIRSLDHDRLAFADPDGSVRLWDLTTADSLDGPALLIGPQPTPSLLAWDRDQRWLMARGGGRLARLWDLSDPGRTARVVELGERGEITQYGGFFVSPNKQWMAATVVPKSGPQSVQLWDLAVEGPSRPRFLQEKDEVFGFVVESSRLLTHDYGRFSLWELRSGVGPSDPRVRSGGWYAHDPSLRPAVTPDGSRLLYRSKGLVVQIWDLENPDGPPAILTQSDKFDRRFGVFWHFTPDGRRWYNMLPHGGVKLWKLDGPGSTVDPVELPDLLGAGDLDGSTSQGPRTDARVQVVPRQKPSLVSWSPDDRWLIDAGRGGKVRLWDLIRPDPFESPALEFDRREPPPPLLTDFWARFTPNSQWLAMTAENNLYLWDLRGKEPRQEPKIPLESAGPVRGFAVDATGQWVALAGSDDRLHLWEVRSEGCLERTILQPAPGPKPWSEFFLSPGGKRVVAIGSDPPARVYRVPMDDLRDAAQQAVGRNLTRDEWKRFFPGQDYHTTFEALPEPPP
jgi:WD40 repeat protein